MLPKNTPAVFVLKDGALYVICGAKDVLQRCYTPYQGVQLYIKQKTISKTMVFTFHKNASHSHKFLHFNIHSSNM